MFYLDCPANHGWFEDLSIDWIEEPYPEDVTELLVTSGNETDVDFTIDDSDNSDSDSDV